MKITAALIFLLLLTPLISAIEFEMEDEFSQGETLMAKVSGNFLLPLQEENVVFYRGHVKIPVDYGIKKIDEEYYIYAVLFGKEPTNYSLILENIRYLKGGEVSEEDAVKNFIITNQTADFSINPGFASESEFSIEVQNLQDSDITINVKTKGDSEVIETYVEEVTLKSGEKEKLEFLFESSEPAFRIIELSTVNLLYEIPVVIPATIQEEATLKFEPSDLVFSTSTDEEITRTIFLYNLREEDLTNITLDLSSSLLPYVNLSQTSIAQIDANSNVQIELTFFSEEEFELEGHIKATCEGEISYSEITAKFLEDYVVSELDSYEYTTKTCAEMNYPICGSNEECNGDIIYAKDNVCCIGVCKEKAKAPIGRIIAIILIIALIGGGIWFYKTKYKKAKKPINLLDIARGKKPDYPKKKGIFSKSN